MKFNKFQHGSHCHEKSGNVKTKVIPFERKAKRDYIRPWAVSKAKIIAFPNGRRKVDRVAGWWSTMGISLESRLGVIGIVIFLLILALLIISHGS